jgi:hypothetical protein
MKVAICIPRYGDTKGEFTISLGRMLVYSLSRPVQLRSGPAGLEIEIFSLASSDLPASRTILLQRAIQWQARYLLWLDTDHVFPPDSLSRLLRREVEFVGVNQARRTTPTGPVTMRFGADGAMEHVWTTAELARADALEEVAHVGLAFSLMDMNLLHKVKAHVEASGPGWANWQPFDRKRLAGTSARMGEDASFASELRDAGVKIHVDHGLSWQIGHIGEHVFTNAETIEQKEAWLSRHR